MTVDGLREMLKVHEGYKHKPYFCTAGKKTIGVGWNMEAHRLPDDIAAFLRLHGCITDEMIERLLTISLDSVMRDCREIFPEFASYTEGRQAAIIDMTFQMGAGIWNGTTADLIKAGKWSRAADRVKTWKYHRQTPERAEENIALLRMG
jgi:lysozyme